MMYGWYYLYKKDKKIGSFLIILFLLTSVGLVLYMNFSDGTRPEKAEYDYWVKAGQPGQMPVVHREVRVRDYFYAAAFMYFGLWIGIAAIAALHTLFLNKDKFLRTAVAPILAVLFMVSPALPLTQNWKDMSRRGDWVPYDYAYNLLNSCEKDGILFTNGDNDTFPLWALQEAYGIRKDVRIINLSLVNTPWYVLQMKHLEPAVPITYTDNQIKLMDASLNPIETPTRYTLSEAGITVTLPSRNEMRVLRVQDQMVINIVDANKWKKPIYFVTSASDGDVMGLSPYLKMEGMVYRVMQQEVAESEKIDIARSAHLLNNVYRYTNLENGKAHLNETSESLLSNYEACFIQVSLALRNPVLKMKNEISLLQSIPDTSESAQKSIFDKKRAYQDTLNLAISMLDKCKNIVPLDWRPRVLLHEILVENGMPKEAEKRMREALNVDPGNMEYQTRLAEVTNNKAESAEFLKKTIGNSDEWELYKSLSDNYKERGFSDSAVGVLQEYLVSHPGDKRATEAIGSVKK
jgi:tetratricopeptide (TPR) repeat protein